MSALSIALNKTDDANISMNNNHLSSAKPPERGTDDNVSTAVQASVPRITTTTDEIDNVGEREREERRERRQSFNSRPASGMSGILSSSPAAAASAQARLIPSRPRRLSSNSGHSSPVGSYISKSSTLGHGSSYHTSHMPPSHNYTNPHATHSASPLSASIDVIKPETIPSSASASTSTLLSTSAKSSVSSTSPAKHSGSGPLNTNSPIGLAAAAAVTPEKLMRLLVSQGPLAIRHITSHLALTIPGFADLSLSKQRRLIIAALDSPDCKRLGVVFEKVGWGRWAARRIEDNTLAPGGTGGAAGSGAGASTTNTLSNASNTSNATTSITSASSSESPSPPSTTSYRRYSKNRRSSSSIIKKEDARARRESITAHLLNAGRPPQSPILRGRGSSMGAFTSGNAISGGGGSTSPWMIDDVELADDDMMFHNGTKKRYNEDNEHAILFDDEEEEEDDDFDEDESDSDYYYSKDTNRRAAAATSSSSSGNHNNSRQKATETDDEDWQAIGAAKLRLSPRHLGIREQEAIDALVQLRSV